MAKGIWESHKKLLIVVGIVVIIALFLMSSFNGFVSLDQNVKSKWSQVENVYQRQADLIPNFVSTANNYKEFEEGLLTKLTEARSKWTQSVGLVEKDKAGLDVNSALTSAFSRLIAVSENYPNLKTSELYKGLQDELAGSQNRISTERGRYIEAVQSFNTAIKTFPGNVLSGIFGFPEKQYYQATAGSLTTPDVGKLLENK